MRPLEATGARLLLPRGSQGTQSLGVAQPLLVYGWPRRPGATLVVCHAPDSSAASDAGGDAGDGGLGADKPAAPNSSTLGGRPVSAAACVLATA